MVQRQNNVAEPIPPFYIRTLSSLEASLSTALAKEKEAKKKMNATNARALNSMKQKVKRAVKEYEKDVKRYQAVCYIYMYNSVHPNVILIVLKDPEAFEREYAAATQGPEVAIHKPGSPPPGDSDNEGAAPSITQFTPVGKGGKAMQFTADAIFKTLQLVQEARGKKVRIRSSRLDVVPNGHVEH